MEWDNVDYNFPILKFEWAADLDGQGSNKELLKLLIRTAMKQHNQENGTRLRFVKYVSANVEAVSGFMFYITFWAKDLSLPNPDQKCYQAKVRKFADEILVRDFRLRPTQELYS